jgi:BASS family bile acid:Na+ symporter
MAIMIVMVSVMFLMLGVGLTVAFRQIIDVARQFGLVARGLLANFLVVPVLIYLSLLWLPIPSDVKIGIMLMAAAPIAPMAPPFVRMAKGDVTYAVGLMAIVALLSVPLTPLILTLALPESTGGLDLDPRQIVKTLLTAQLIPISVGMTIRSASPTWSRRLLKFVPKIGQIGLIVGIGLILAAQAKQILSMGWLPHLVILLWVVATLFIGDWMLIGESRGRRCALAVSTAIRNVPLAFLIAGENFPGTVVAPVVLVFGTLSMIISIVYGKVTLRSKVAG